MRKKLILMQIFLLIFSIKGNSQDSLRLNYGSILNKGEVYQEIIIPNYDSMFFYEIDFLYKKSLYSELVFQNLGIENLKVQKDESGKLNCFTSVERWILNIQKDSLYTENNLWTKKYLKDSTILTDSNEYIYYRKFKNDSVSFQNRFLIFKDSIVRESYIPIQTWDVKGTSKLYDNENYLREIFVLKKGLIVSYIFDEIYQGQINKEVYTFDFLKTGERQMDVYFNMCRSDSSVMERTKLSIETIGSNQLSKYMVNYLVSCYTSGSSLTEPKFLPLLIEYYPSMLGDW